MHFLRPCQSHADAFWLDPGTLQQSLLWMQAALGKRAISDTLAPELEEAKALGITDGSNPNAFCTRAQAAIMTKRAMKGE